jgi:hypothetical protein
MAPRYDLRYLADNKNAYYKRIFNEALAEARAEARDESLAQMMKRIQDKKQEY